MKKILQGDSRRVGAILSEIDTNFIEVSNSIMRIAFPDYTLLGFADTEPAAPVLFDCYLVKEDSTIWSIEVQKNDFIAWNGLAWEILPFKLTEINDALQFLYFDAENIAISPVSGLTATNTQQALIQLTASIIAHGITIVPLIQSGSSS